MFDTSARQCDPSEAEHARDWVKILSSYRAPSTSRSLFELGVTLVPFVMLWALAWWALSFSPILAFVISLFNAGFLVRLFAIQHDCGHSAFFANRQVGDWLGRGLGVLTLTPYDVWRRSHAQHHSGSGNLDRRGMGDISTLTISEYRALTPWQRFGYRLYRHPVVLFILGPAYLFLLQNRLPLGLTGQVRYWVSAMITNAAILAALSTIWYFGGLMPLLLIFLPSTLLASSLGVWLFYVQHQFETTHWEQDQDWDLHEAALHGSSHYVMPAALQWMSANIGIHHVHHLYSRIPFYRLPEVLRDQPVLAASNRMTIPESFANARLHLWDEKGRRLLSFAQAESVR